MKIVKSPNLKQAASALVVTLVICTLLSVFVMSYLSLCEQQTRLNSRSQAWNLAISVTEAGVEEGLQHLNSNYPNLTVDGWTYDGTLNMYWRSNNLGDGNGYAVFMSVTNALLPVIIAKAYVQPPSLAVNYGSTMFAAAGVNVGANAPLARAVLVTCSKGNMFTAALVVKRNIDLNGNGIYTDSFNSQDPTKSTNGRYDSSKYQGDQGDIASDGSVVNSSVSIGNANIYGHAHLGPNCTITYGPGGGVGPHSGQGKPTPGWVVNDANFTFPDTTPPSVASTWGPSCSGDVRSSSNYVTIASTNSSSYTTPPQGNVVTNITSWNTNSVNPGAGTVGLVTNVGVATIDHYPGPMPGLTTNTIVTTSNNVPAAGTYLGNVTTVPYNNQTTLPSPLPSSITTNYQTTIATTPAYPTPGTYVGSVTTNWNGGHTHIDSYAYNKINGYTYNYNLYSFNRITGYFSYSTFTYSWPNLNYAWSLFTTNTFYITNSYSHLFFANQNYKEASLTGSACVLGVNVTVYLPNGLTGTDYINYQTPGTVWVRSCGSTNWAVVSIPQIPTMLVYAGGTTVGITGNNVVNPNGFPGNFIVYCAPTVTSFSLAGNGAFTGILVAPNADLTLNGGGSGNEDFCGSIMAQSATLNGHFSFHYDEALNTSPSNGRYLVTTWNEIKPN